MTSVRAVRSDAGPARSATGGRSRGSTRCPPLSPPAAIRSASVRRIFRPTAPTTGARPPGAAPVTIIRWYSSRAIPRRSAVGRAARPARPVSTAAIRGATISRATVRAGPITGRASGASGVACTRGGRRPTAIAAAIGAVGARPSTARSASAGSRISTRPSRGATARSGASYPASVSRAAPVLGVFRRATMAPNRVPTRGTRTLTRAARRGDGAAAGARPASQASGVRLVSTVPVCPSASAPTPLARASAASGAVAASSATGATAAYVVSSPSRATAICPARATIERRAIAARGTAPIPGPTFLAAIAPGRAPLRAGGAGGSAGSEARAANGRAATVTAIRKAAGGIG